MRTLFKTLSTSDGFIFGLFLLMLSSLLVGGAFYLLATTIIAICLMANGVFSLSDRDSNLIIWFAITYAVIEYWTGFIREMPPLYYHAVMPVFFYLFGRYLAIKCRTEANIISSLLCVILAIGIVVYYITFTEVSRGNLISAERMFNVYSGEESLSATMIGVLVSLGMAGLSIGLFAPKVNQKCLWYIVFFASLLSVIHLVNRSGLFVAVICTAIVGVFYSNNKRTKWILYLLIFAGILAMSGVFDGLQNEIFTAYEDRSLANDNGGDRLERWIEALQILPAKPFGWRIAEGDHSVHNMWLDTAKVVGIIPFILLCVVTYRSLKLTYILNRKFKSSASLVFLAINICFFLSEFVEPVNIGVPTYMFLNFFVWGMQRTYYNSYIK